MRFFRPLAIAVLGVALASPVAACQTHSVSGSNNPPPTCGNGQLDTDESCDGSDLGGATCAGLGFAGGALECTPQCTLDTARCSNDAICGDGVVQAPEQCDGAGLGGVTCADFGFGGGTLGCTTSCEFDLAGCTATNLCGNGVIDTGEACDGADLGGHTCVTEGHVAGNLSCTNTCQLDDSACVDALCGNGAIEVGEDCDGALLGGESCVGLGWGGGTLACDSSCGFDESNCFAAGCNNGSIDPGEDCDGTDLGGESCVGLGWGGGTLTCDNSCSFDESGCQTCGNGIVEGDEQCDGGVGGASCGALGFTGGSLACTGCKLDPSGCTGGCTVSGGSVSCGTNLSANNGSGTDVVNNWTGNRCPNAVGHSGDELIYSYATGSSYEGLAVSITGLTENLNLLIARDLGGGCASGLPCVASSSAAISSSESVEFIAEPNQTYYIIVDGVFGASSNFTLDVTCAKVTRQILEYFPAGSITDTWDLTGTSLTFVPDANTFAGYTWSRQTGVSNYPTSPGSGTSSAALGFTQQNESIEITLPASFVFFGTSYTALFVNSHGSLTFGTGDPNGGDSANAMRTGPPRIAGHWDMMNVTSSGTVTVDEFADRVVVTYDQIADPFSLGTHSTQISLFLATGEIVLTNLSSGGSDGTIGIGEGGGGIAPGEVNFN